MLADFKNCTCTHAQYSRVGPESSLPLWRKLCFAVGGVPYQMTSTVIGFFLNIFLLEVAEVRKYRADTNSRHTASVDALRFSLFHVCVGYPHPPPLNRCNFERLGMCLQVKQICTRIAGGLCFYRYHHLGKTLCLREKPNFHLVHDLKIAKSSHSAERCTNVGSSTD